MKRGRHASGSCHQKSSRRCMLKECLRKKKSISKGVDSELQKPTDLGGQPSNIAAHFFTVCWTSTPFPASNYCAELSGFLPLPWFSYSISFVSSRSVSPQDRLSSSAIWVQHSAIGSVGFYWGLRAILWLLGWCNWLYFPL